MPVARRVPLSRERVVQEAIALVDAEGLDGLSMRALGRRLDVQAMTLYHHVPNKAALLDAMVEEAMAPFSTVTPVSGDWREEISRLLRQYRAIVLAHPNLFELLMTHNQPAGDQLDLGEAHYRRLLDAGLAPHDVIAASWAMSGYVIGFLLTEVRLDVKGRENEWIPEAMSVDPARYPATSEVLKSFDGDWDRHFEDGLRMVLDGVEAQMRSPARGTGDAKRAASRRGTGSTARRRRPGAAPSKS